MFKDEPWIRPALVVGLITLACALVVQASTGYLGQPKGYTSLRVAIIVIAVSAMTRLLITIFRMMREGVERPFDRLREMAPAALRDQMVIVIAVALVALLLFSTSFLKSMITAVIPFWADEPFARLDSAIGLDGKALANTLGGWLPAVGFFYGLWHLSNLGGILWVIHWRQPSRGHFILSFMLTWGIGMVAAYFFSSAGPLFTGRYDLATAPASVRLPAEMLWANYQAKGALLGGGISAFPSLHVAIATWFALVLADRGWPKLGIAYVAAIYFGSVVLGWHYGADGAGGIAVALIANWVARRLLLPRPKSEQSVDPAVTTLA